MEDDAFSSLKDGHDGDGPPADGAMGGAGSGLRMMVFVDVWYTSADLPGVMQSFTWQTVDVAPDFPRGFGFVQQLIDTATVHHFQIRQMHIPVPDIDMKRLHPYHPTMQ